MNLLQRKVIDFADFSSSKSLLATCEGSPSYRLSQSIQGVGVRAQGVIEGGKVMTKQDESLTVI